MDRKQFEEWFKTTDAYKLLEEMNYFKIDLFIFKEHRSQYQHTTVQIAYMTWQHQQAKVEVLQRRNQMLSDSTLEMGTKHIRDTDLINQQASKLFRLREFIYGSGDLREYSDEELLEHQRILKAIVTGEQALKGEGQ